MDALNESLRFAVSCGIYVVAYCVGLLVFAAMAKRRGMANEAVAILAIAGLAGGALGAQLTQSFLGGIPGKSLLGGIACGYLAVIFAKRSLKIVRPTGDLFAPAIAAGEAVGRLGCFFFGCCYGKAANVAWAVEDHGVYRHPTQLYSAAAAAATFGLLMVIERRRALPENGLFYVQGVLLCAFRFVIEFYREVPTTALGLTTAQFACIVGVAFFGARLAIMLRRMQPQSSYRAVAA